MIGTSAGRSRDEVTAVSPRHKAVLDPFFARGDIVGIGPLVDAAGSNMAPFRSREATETFAAGDPFMLKRLVTRYGILDWAGATLR